jgi:hypothetical protein
VGAIKNGVRVVLVYNRAPLYLWYHAMVYYIDTYNQVPRRNEMRSKEVFLWHKIRYEYSRTILPFSHRPKEIRTDKVYSQRADQCRFIGYAIDVNWINSQQIS